MASLKHFTALLLLAGVVVVLLTFHIFISDTSFQMTRTDYINSKRLRMYVTNLPKSEVETDNEQVSSSLPTSKCNPIQSIVLAKTHKTASSTLAVILSRYGYERNLTFALPKVERRMFFGFTPFAPSMLLAQPEPPGFHILNNHVPFNKSGMAEIMRPEAKYVTIIRDPVTHFFSTVRFFGISKKLNFSGSAWSTDFPLQDLLAKISNWESYQAKILYNGQLFCLGFNRTETVTDIRSVFRAVDKLENEMDLILITEYFDESLILLKKLMCWTFEDILYIAQKRSGVRYSYSEEARKFVLSWNFADVILYDHFNKSLWQKIDQYGPTFWEDLTYFQRINNKINHICANPGKTLNLQNDTEVLSLNINKNYTKFCGNLDVDDYPYTVIVRDSFLSKNNNV